MRNNRKCIIILSLLFLVFMHTQAYPYSEGSHAALNEHIARNNVNDFSLNSYLVDILRFASGVDETFEDGETYRVWRWFMEGGKKEDRPGDMPKQWMGYLTNNARNNNHFHNPILFTYYLLKHR